MYYYVSPFHFCASQKRASARKRFERLLKLDTGSKCEIVIKEIELAKEQMRKRSEEYERVIDHMKVETHIVIVQLQTHIYSSSKEL